MGTYPRSIFFSYHFFLKKRENNMDCPSILSTAAFVQESVWYTALLVVCTENTILFVFNRLCFRTTLDVWICKASEPLSWNMRSVLKVFVCSLKFSYWFYVNFWVLCLSAYMFNTCVDAFVAWKMFLVPQKPELHAVVSHCVDAKNGTP